MPGGIPLGAMHVVFLFTIVFFDGASGYIDGKSITKSAYYEFPSSSSSES